MRILFAFLISCGISRGLYITDARARDPSRPLPLPPEAPTPILYGMRRRQSVSPSASSSPSIPVAPARIPLSPPKPAPTPMDLQLSYALSTSCLSHLSSLLSSNTFQSCLPFSLLLTTSTSFAALLSTSSTSGNYTILNDLLAYVSSPQPSGTECDDFMHDAYDKMGDKNACGADLGNKGKAGVAAAKDAKTGLGNAGLMRIAAGLRDPDTGSWCYLQALDGDRPDDLYLWALPAGIALPPSAKPTCSKCSSLLLNHYTSSASSTPALNSTLVNAAIGTINSACGPGFAQYSAEAPSSFAGASRSGNMKGLGHWGSCSSLIILVSAMSVSLVV